MYIQIKLYSESLLDYMIMDYMIFILQHFELFLLLDYYHCLAHSRFTRLLHIALLHISLINLYICLHKICLSHFNILLGAANL